MEKETKELIEKILHEIAEDIITKFDNKEIKNDLGLLSGKSGISLFMYYIARYYKNERYEDYAQKILDDVFHEINNGNLYPTYCSGIAGVCWTINHLIEEGFIEKGNIHILDKFDDFLFRAMKEFIEINNFDFLHGATGIAYYFTKRAEENKDLMQFLEYYVKKLWKYADYDKGEKIIKIISTILDENKNPKKVYNLSMSHGMSSIIIILCKISKLIKDKSKCFLMIEGMSNYIKSNKLRMNPATFSLYPHYIETENTKTNLNSRLSWCYGDIGNAFAFSIAGKILRNDDFLEHSKEIFIALRKRKNLKLQLIHDAGICHGSSGICAIFLNELLSRNLQIAKDLTNFWLNVTLDFYKSENDILGFNRYTKEGFKYESNLLNGLSGIGLVFLSFISRDIFFKWSDLLLISKPI